MKKVVIDARESGETTGRYIDKLIEYLHKLKPDLAITVLTKPHRVAFIKQVAPAFEVIESPYKEFTFDEQLGLRRQVKKLKPDLVHFGIVQQPVWYSGKTVTTMHDLTTTRFNNPDKNRFVYAIKQSIYKWVNKRVAKKANAIITPTQFVKDDVVRFTHIDPVKITVIYEAADAIDEPAEPLGFLDGKRFIMYLGRPMPHKNLERLIEALVMLQAKYPDLLLVLTGKKDNNYLRIEHLTKTKNITNVIFTDFVTEGQLRWLYGHCAAYVFPSLSEGFGLPGLEAMQHGAPVISSNATCLPEVYGSGAHYFNPLDIPAMAQAIVDVLEDKKLRDKLIKAGKKQVKKYSWQKMAEETLEIYKSIL